MELLSARLSCLSCLLHGAAVVIPLILLGWSTSKGLYLPTDILLHVLHKKMIQGGNRGLFSLYVYDGRAEPFSVWLQKSGGLEVSWEPARTNDPFERKARPEPHTVLCSGVASRTPWVGLTFPPLACLPSNEPLESDLGRPSPRHPVWGDYSMMSGTPNYTNSQSL